MVGYSIAVKRGMGQGVRGRIAVVHGVSSSPPSAQLRTGRGDP
jgi:hypothetical protein